LSLSGIDQVLPQDVRGPSLGALREHDSLVHCERGLGAPQVERACHIRFTAMIVPIVTTSIAISTATHIVVRACSTARLHEPKHAPEILALDRELDGARARD
jgi:hypothetical protein